MTNDIVPRARPILAVNPAMTGKPRLHVGMLLFPGLTLLDLVGPQTVLEGPMHTHLMWKTTDPVRTDTGLEVRPTLRFEDVVEPLDVLFVPGGPGQIEVFGDDEVLRFVGEQGARAKWVTSVCTGSLILGAAGLLQGYRATSHWAARDLLSAFGAELVAERVVIDRNRITGGGVTAGIDFGLQLLALIYGADVARTTQLLMEYDPAPPFDAGNVTSAGQHTVDQAFEVMRPIAEETMAAIEDLAGKAVPGRSASSA